MDKEIENLFPRLVYEKEKKKKGGQFFIEEIKFDFLMFIRQKDTWSGSPEFFSIAPQSPEDSFSHDVAQFYNKKQNKTNKHVPDAFGLPVEIPRERFQWSLSAPISAVFVTAE